MVLRKGQFAVLFRRLSGFCNHNLARNGWNSVSYRESSSNYNHEIRSHLCGSLSLTEAEKQEEVSICGWLHSKRFDNRFWIIRDWSGLVQVTIDDDKRAELGEQLGQIPLESVVQVRGVPQRRPKEQENLKMPTGKIEIRAQQINVLNKAMKLPFSPSGELHQVNETLRMQYRYLDLRRSVMQRNLRLRSDLMMKMRHFLHNQHHFVDVETPYLFRRTPGGAREFIVPSSQLPGKFYALAQSPQQFKQLLMVAGLDRYFQIARCFRDETNNPEKQPEFTQLDLEMSFIDMESIIELIQDLIIHSWPQDLGTPPLNQFPRMSYNDAMEHYGSDKPDTRFEMRLKDTTEWCRQFGYLTTRLNSDYGASTKAHAFLAKNAVEHCKTGFRKSMEQLMKKEFGDQAALMFLQCNEDGSFKPSINNEAQNALTELGLQSKAGDLVVFCAGKFDTCLKALGRVRLELVNHLETHGVNVREKGFKFLWVVDFPLFARTESSNMGSPSQQVQWETVHHPFTAPHPQDEHLLLQEDLNTDLTKVRGQHYDLVLNGAEVGGGSIRVHNAALQRRILSLLDIRTDELHHLLDALDSGCPPHGGIALGLDRLVSILAGQTNIRQVIAFPKSISGRDLMGDAPCVLPVDQLQPYHISVRDSTSLSETRQKNEINDHIEKPLKCSQASS